MRIEIDQEDFEKKLLQAAAGIGLDIQESLKRKLTISHGRDTGGGMSNIKSRARKIPEGVEIEISMPEHMKYLEFGTPPHMPPVEALEGWAERKLGDKDAAWALALHIKRFGTRPYPFIRTTFNNELSGIINRNLKESFK